jgi:hypothetical protein
VSEETLKEKQANLTGQNMEEFSNGKKSSSMHHSGQNNSIKTNGSSLKSIARIIGSEKKGMILPFMPLSLVFDDIKYSVDMPQVCGHL